MAADQFRIPVNEISDGDKILEDVSYPNGAVIIENGAVIGDFIQKEQALFRLAKIKKETILVRRKTSPADINSAKHKKITETFSRDVMIAYEELEEFGEKVKPLYEKAAAFLNNIRLKENGEFDTEYYERVHNSRDYEKFRGLVELGILNETSCKLLKKLREKTLPLAGVFGAYAMARKPMGEKATHHAFQMLAAYFDYAIRAEIPEEKTLEKGTEIMLHDLGLLAQDREGSTRINKEALSRIHGLLAYKVLVPDEAPVKGITLSNAISILQHPFRYDGRNAIFNGAMARPQVFVSEEFAKHQDYKGHDIKTLTQEAMELRVLEEYVSHAFGDPVAGIEKFKGENWESNATLSLEKLIYDNGNVNPKVLESFVVNTTERIIPRKTLIEVSLGEVDINSGVFAVPKLKGVIVNSSYGHLFLYDKNGDFLDTELPESSAKKDKILAGHGRIVKGIDGKDYTLPGVNDGYVKLMMIDSFEHLGCNAPLKVGIADSRLYTKIISYLIEIRRANFLDLTDIKEARS